MPFKDEQVDAMNALSMEATRPPRSRRLVLNALALLTTVLLAAACGESSTGPQEPGGGGSTLTAAVGITGTHQWEPHLTGHDTLPMIKFMHDSLTDIDKDTGEVIPMLAESWSLSPDGKTWTFKLRDDVVFQDGLGKLTSNDVKFTWREWMRDDSNHHNAQQLRDIVGNNIDNIEIVSDTEFKILAPEPYTTLDSFLAQPVSASLHLVGEISDRAAGAGEDASDRHRPVGVRQLDTWCRDRPREEPRLLAHQAVVRQPDPQGDPRPGGTARAGAERDDRHREREFGTDGRGQERRAEHHRGT